MPHLCLPSLCTSPLCLSLCFKPVCLLFYKHAISMYKLFNNCQPEKEFINMNFQLNQNPRINQANYFLRQNYDSGKNILLNRFVHLNGKIEKSWLDLSLNSFKIKCKQLFLQSNSINWYIQPTTNYWVPNKPPTTTVKTCTIILSKALDKIIILNQSYLDLWVFITNVPIIQRLTKKIVYLILFKCAPLKII